MTSENQPNEQEDKTYPFAIDYLPDEYRLKAEIELNEIPENYIQSLKKLKQMIASEDEMKEIEFHDDFLRQFLRQSKYDVNRSLKRLQDFVKFKEKNGAIFENIDLEEVSKTPDYKYATPLPWRCRDGCAIVIFEYSKWDPSGIALNDLLRIGMMMFHQSLRNPLTQINGFKMIVDWKDSSLSQLKYTNPKSLFMAYKAVMICTPARVKEVHFVNESAVMRAIWTLFKPFAPDKIKKRMKSSFLLVLVAVLACSLVAYMDATETRSARITRANSDPRVLNTTLCIDLALDKDTVGKLLDLKLLSLG